MMFSEGDFVLFREDGKNPARSGRIVGTVEAKPKDYIVEIKEGYKFHYIVAHENELRRKYNHGTEKHSAGSSGKD